MSHTVLAEFTCLPGKADEFLEVLLAALPDTRAFEGCEGIDTYRDQDNADVVVLWEKWVSRPNHEAYVAWRIETGMLDLIGPYMASELRFLHLSRAD